MRGLNEMDVERTPWRGLAGFVMILVLSGFGCSKLTEMRIEGEWESDATPKRTLVLNSDGTYLERFSGKTLGFVSDVLGPDHGRWHVEARAVVLVRQESSGAETTRRLPMGDLESDSVLLAGERWHRVKR